MIAVHFENLLFLLFIAVAVLFQLLTRAASKAGKDSGQTGRRSTSAPPRIPRAPEETDEERIRKFLEALGQPPTSKPPPPVAHRTDIPPRPVAPIAPPPTMRPFSLPQRRLTPEERRKRSVILHEVSRAREPIFEVREGPPSAEPPPIVKTPAEAYAIATQPVTRPKQTEINIAALLRSTSGLRNAIILREIFGPPRSLQPLDLIGCV